MNVTFRLDSPLHHGAFSDADTGNLSVFRRIPIRIEDTVHDIPAVSGNAIRGCIRRELMRHLFDETGTTAATIGPSAYQRLYAALVNGGHLEGSEAAVKPEERAAIRAALPALSVLGAALYSYMLAGRCEIGVAWLVCAETRAAGLVGARPYVIPSAEDQVREYSHVRHIDRDAHDPDASAVTPMPTTMETVITGAELECRITFNRATELEASALAFGLSRVRFLGGKRSAGLGVVTVDAPDLPSPNIYTSWLAENRGAVKQALSDLAISMVGKKAKK